MEAFGRSRIFPLVMNAGNRVEGDGPIHGTTSCIFKTERNWTLHTSVESTASTRSTLKPYAALLLGVLSISTSAVFVKLSDAPEAIVALYRLLFTVVLMTPWVAVHGRTELKSLKRKDWLLALVSGVFLAFHFLFWFTSLAYTSVASSVVLVAMQPLFAFIGTYVFFKERTTLQALLGAGVAMTGSVIIGWGDFRIGGMALFGDLLALLGAAMVTGYWLIGQHVRKNVSLMVYTYVVYGASSVTLFVYNAFNGASFTNYAAKDWWIFLALAVIPTLLGHTVLNWSLKWVGASVVSVSILGEPIGASVLAYAVFGETLSVSQWIGGGLILFGVYAFVRTKNRVGGGG